MRKTIKMVFIVAIFVSILIGITFASNIISKQVYMTMRIKDHAAIELYHFDHNTPLKTIKLGDFYRYETKVFPSTTLTYGQHYLIKNIGDYDVWIKWSKTGLPKEVNLIMMVDYGEGFKEVMEEKVISTSLQVHKSFRWYFIVTVSETAELGDFSPKLMWIIQDIAE